MFAKISWTGILSARAITGQLCCLVVASSMGCATLAGLQDTQYCLTNKTRAEISWLTCNDWKQRWDLGSDYAAGYKKGFYDAATGRGCKLPAVPPPCYWSAKYQSCEGQEAVACWYRGYQCGTAAAQSKGYPSFHDVPVGPCAPSINVTGCQGCYSPDNCACNAPIQQFSDPLMMPTHEHQFHGGLFGQYGSALSLETQLITDTMGNIETVGDQVSKRSPSGENSYEAAPNVSKPRNNSLDAKSDSEVGSLNDKSASDVEVVSAKTDE